MFFNVSREKSRETLKNMGRPGYEAKLVSVDYLSYTCIASYPGLPMFFNVSREKSGRRRPGRSGDVMDAVWAAVSLSPPTRPRNILYSEKLASTVNGTAAQCTSQSVRV